MGEGFCQGAWALREAFLGDGQNGKQHQKHEVNGGGEAQAIAAIWAWLFGGVAFARASGDIGNYVQSPLDQLEI